jgi:type III secretion protein Q
LATAERRARNAKPHRDPMPPAAPAPRSLRGLLPALDAPSCEALNTFFAVPRWWLLGDGAAIQASPAKAPPSAFAIDAEGARLALQVDGPATAGHDDARLRWSDHGGRARVLAWSLAQETTLRRLSEWLGTSLLPVLDDGGSARGEPPHALWLEVLIEDEPAGDAGEDGRDAGATTPSEAAPATRARLRLPAAWLPALAARAEPPYEHDPVPDAGRWRTFQVPVSLLFPITLSVGDWRALRPGDVVVAGSRGRLPTCVARATGRDWPLVPGPGGWAVRDQSVPAPVFNEDPTMNDHEQAGATPAEAAPAADPARRLPMQLEFELGRTEMSIGELADLQPGYVFPLATALEGSNVTIRANGRVAGRGELVAVGDTLGVRLLSWG